MGEFYEKNEKVFIDSYGCDYGYDFIGWMC